MADKFKQPPLDLEAEYSPTAAEQAARRARDAKRAEARTVDATPILARALEQALGGSLDRRQTRRKPQKGGRRRG